MFEVNPECEITAITDIGPDDRSAVVIDKFYKNPDEIRQLALKLERRTHDNIGKHKKQLETGSQINLIRKLKIKKLMSEIDIGNRKCNKK